MVLVSDKEGKSARDRNQFYLYTELFLSRVSEGWYVVFIYMQLAYTQYHDWHISTILRNPNYVGELCSLLFTTGRSILGRFPKEICALFLYQASKLSTPP